MGSWPTASANKVFTQSVCDRGALACAAGIAFDAATEAPALELAGPLSAEPLVLENAAGAAIATGATNLEAPAAFTAGTALAAAAGRVTGG